MSLNFRNRLPTESAGNISFQKCRTFMHYLYADHCFDVCFMDSYIYYIL